MSKTNGSKAGGSRRRAKPRAAAGSRNAVKDVWGERTPFDGAWPARVDHALAAEPDEWVQSCCVLCSNGCGLDIGVKDGRIVGVRGRGSRAPAAAGSAGPKVTLTNPTIPRSDHDNCNPVASYARRRKQ
jgi:anaerobic selenocysteine-containing dehydrogenase